ncbi:DUF6228 family protein [Arthrobacter sp. BE255]|uniref:DUF6228 family protein n=1 Tax=Arthrobacter sp. BE255 TaxID=2817721 RepID=UPI00286B3958|nr:DUF6228 family protein [Arthrobacter sp. BE255]
MSRAGRHNGSLFDRHRQLNWRGWSGRKTYESLEGDLVLNAEHDGHIRLSFTLSQVSKLQGWTLTAEVTLDPGEELAVVAQELELILANYSRE